MDELAAFRTWAPGMPDAHPTEEHLTPLFLTLGAANDPTAQAATTIDGFWLDLAKRSLQVTWAPLAIQTARPVSPGAGPGGPTPTKSFRLAG